eukprot:gnl/MRDRNA2_/MRDRNA2_85089_c0_seq5.p1 gnl/MRDRNA2_/MRDRNA2_85089_c0~~gnl/MRDRNA2_/MRDRNA2_85089_c0_seq5.p1  ORF type:complete len:254 (-),score=37.11 gnl/MRDRNA2_/MRDRNA2_85089_c0_seq5:475-1236(-)
MKKSEEMEAQVQSCHLHFKDRFGLPVAVQVFCSALLGHDGKPMYFLGIREDADTSGLRALRQQEAVANSIPEASVIGFPADFNTDNVGDHGRTQDSHNNGSRRSRNDSVRSSSNSSNSSTRGTPHLTFSQALQSSRITWSTVSDRRRKQIRNKGCIITPPETIILLVEEFMSRINCDATNIYVARCCQWHLALGTILQALKMEMKNPCDASFSSCHDKQCCQCRLMAENDEEQCPLCGQDRFYAPPHVTRMQL